MSDQQLYRVVLTPEQLQVVLSALGDLPLRVAHGAYATIKGQCVAQDSELERQLISVDNQLFAARQELAQMVDERNTYATLYGALPVTEQENSTTLEEQPHTITIEGQPLAAQ